MHTLKSIAVAATLISFSTAAPAEEHRQLGAHVHGHGRLNIAIEGNRVSMELEVPGADIVGFEHEASTPEQKDALAKAKAKLADALTLFIPPPQAGCALDHANVAIKAEEHEHEDEEDHEHEHEAEGAEHHHHHSEFHAEYELKCQSPSNLTSLSFGYFNAFAGGQELDITVIGPKGQSSFEVTRDKSSVDLAGIM